MIMLLLIWFGRETCSINLREEHHLQMYENEVSRKTFGHKKYAVTEQHL